MTQQLFNLLHTVDVRHPLLHLLKVNFVCLEKSKACQRIAIDDIGKVSMVLTVHNCGCGDTCTVVSLTSSAVHRVQPGSRRYECVGYMVPGYNPHS